MSGLIPLLIVFAFLLDNTCYMAWHIHANKLASFPDPHRFRLHEERRGPGIFSHMRDVKGRKDFIEHGHTGAQNGRKS